MADSEIKKVVTGVDIARSPADVFAFVSDAKRLHEWQEAVREAEVETPGVAGVGMRGRETRRVGGKYRTLRWEVTECVPERRWGIRGIDGPVRAHVTIDVRDTDGGSAAHVDYGIGFEGRGIGKLFAVLARKAAATEAAENLGLLKARLEQAG